MNHQSRLLRIEPLESRTLLAGNLFASDDIALDMFIDVAASSLPQLDLEAGQTQEVRTIESSNGSNVQEQSRPSQANIGSDPIQNSEVDFASQQLDFASRVAVALPLGQGQQSQQSSESTATNRPSVPAIDAAFATLNVTESTQAVDATITSALEPQFGLADEQVLDSPIVSDVDSSQSQLAPFVPDNSVTSQAPADGLIELSPLNLDHSLEDSEVDSRLPWKFDLGVLPQIRSVIEKASSQRADIADEAIASWFGEPGGMIAIDQVLLPASSVIAGVDWLNVLLESTLKLHRSLELISGGNAQLLSDTALDAIMASLGEIAESQVQPIGGNHRMEIPKFAYPTIAILTAAVIAARRKRRHSDPLVVGETPSD